MSNDKIEKLEELIIDSIEGELLEQRVEALVAPGENYGSILKKVDFKVKHNGKIKEYHAVAKCPPTNPITTEFFNIQNTFRTEIGWYTTVIPTWKKFIKEMGLKKEISFFQKFYGARISADPTSDKVDTSGVILTENLKYSGYENIDRHQGFTKSATESILTDLATFHAISLAMRQKDPKLFQTNMLPYASQLNFSRTEVKEHYDNDLVNMFDKLAEFKEYMPRIEKAIRNANTFGVRDLREPWITMAHLDLWCNNIMVTPQGRNKILDLQCTNLGTPASDVSLLLLTSVNMDVIDEYLHYFLHFYHTELVNNLTQFNIELQEFSYDRFVREFQLEMKHEFQHAVQFSNLVMSDKGKSDFDASDASFTEDRMKEWKFEVNERQLKRVKWLTWKAVQNGWI